MRVLLCAAIWMLNLVPSAVAQTTTAMLPRRTTFVSLADVRAGKQAAPAALERRVTISLKEVPLAEALRRIALQAGLGVSYRDAVEGLQRPVSARFDNATVAEALEEVLRGTEYGLLISERGLLVLVRTGADAMSAKAQTGTLTGVVRDAKTGSAIAGAEVLLEGTRRRMATGGDGRYRMGDVTPSDYTLVVRRIGYAREARAVTVAAGREVVADVALQPVATPLEDVVVTGTAFAARVKTLPNPISVLSAEDIERKHATSIGDLLRGEIPGVMPLTAGQEDFRPRIYVRGNAGGSTEDLIKIYVDGVEVSHPYYLSTIDPKSIERIEVVRGPQASVIYGSEAASGVLQIFTKKGRPGLNRPQLDLQASAGIVESDYTPAGVSQPTTQDHSAAVSGGSSEAVSYRAGASYVTVGEWVNNYGSRSVGLSGGLRAVQGPLTAELSGVWSNRGYGRSESPLFASFPLGACPPCGNPEYLDNQDYSFGSTTVGLTVGYRATRRWQHTLILGEDQNRWSYDQPEPSRTTPADTFVSLGNREYRRHSVRYHTAYQTSLLNGVTGRFTLGADYWSYGVQGSTATNLLSATGSAVRASTRTVFTIENDRWWNAGYFGMAELGFADQFFLTFAGRVEDNPNLGEDYGVAVSPRVGASYVRAVGPLEVKLRGQYGEGVRPPPPYARAGTWTTIKVSVPNPAIGPEDKSGWDAGVELYLGGTASLGVTRYDERARNLIASVPYDLTATPPAYQYQNIGRARSRGWELEAGVRVGSVSLRANYTYSDNVVQEVTAAVAADPNATLRVGDRTFLAPKHSGGGEVTVHVGRGSASVGASVMAGGRFLDYLPYMGYLYGGQPFRGSVRDYYVEYPALWRANLRAEQALAARLTAFLRIDNLWNAQDSDLFNLYVSQGRTTVIGARFVY